MDTTPRENTDFELMMEGFCVQQVTPRKCYLEIGSAMGGSLRHWSKFMDPGAKLIGVDLPRDFRMERAVDTLNATVALLNEQGFDAQMIFGSSWDEEIQQEVRDVTGCMVDVLLIDGDHTTYGAASDFKYYAPMVRPGGVIMMHDCGFQGKDTEIEKLYRMQRVRGIFAAEVYDKKSILISHGKGMGVMFV